MSRVVCTWQEVKAVDAVACYENERVLWERQKQIQDTFKNVHDANQRLPMVKPPRLPIVPPGRLSVARAETVKDLSIRYSTAEMDLSAALAPAQGKDVTLLDPSPYGRASFLWKDDKGLRNVATVLRSGNVVTTKTAK